MSLRFKTATGHSVAPTAKPLAKTVASPPAEPAAPALSSSPASAPVESVASAKRTRAQEQLEQLRQQRRTELLAQRQSGAQVSGYVPKELKSDAELNAEYRERLAKKTLINEMPNVGPS